MSDPVVIVAAQRTPIGGFLGQFSTYSAIQLAVASHHACIKASHLPAENIDEVIMGCVLTAGLGQAPARQTAILAGLSPHSHCSTVNKVCGSGMQAIIHGHDSIQANRANIVLCGGMESMSQAPYLLPQARKGLRLGHSNCLDHLWYDGLQDAYDPERKLMGCFAELTAETLKISREAQDEFARQSMSKALDAQEQGAFDAEIVPMEHGQRDEAVQAQKLEKLGRLKPVFVPNGTVTAGNSSSIADGAASLILMKASQAKQLQLPALAKILGFSQFSQDPQWFSTAPIYAIQKLLHQLNWSTQNVDLWEINEAFAVVALATIQHLNLDVSKVNVHGGACALGHPIGASGARILVSLIHALKRHQVHKGIATVCIGGGEALAIAIENV